MNRDIGTVTFASGNGNLKLRAADGSGRAAFNVGAGGTGATTGTTNPAANNLVDLTGHSSDLLISTLAIGNQARVGNLNTTFNFDTGTLDATGVAVGFHPGTATSTATLIDTLNLNGGSVTIGTGGLEIGNNSYNQAGVAITNGIVNVSSATLTIANSATLGAAIRLTTNSGGAANGGKLTGTLSITGGSVSVGGDIIKGTTTGIGVNSAVVTLNGGLLDLGGHNLGIAGGVIDTLNLQSGTLKNLLQVNNGGGIAKTAGAGTNTLILEGSNLYSGGTTISSGTVQVGTGGATGTLGSGTVNDNGALKINHNDNVALAQVIQGIGNLEQAGTLSTATTTLSAQNTYTGTTVVSGGKLLLDGSASTPFNMLGNTAIGVSNNAVNSEFDVKTFGPSGGVVNAGTTTAGSAGATLNLDSSTVFGMQDGNVGTFNLRQQASFGAGTTALTLNGATLNFDLSSAGADLLAVNVGSAAVSGTNTIGLAVVGSTLTPGTYPIITANTGLAGTYQFSNGLTHRTVLAGATGYELSLLVGATAIQVRVEARQWRSRSPVKPTEPDPPLQAGT